MLLLTVLRTRRDDDRRSEEDLRRLTTMLHHLARTLRVIAGLGNNKGRHCKAFGIPCNNTACAYNSHVGSPD